MMTLAFAVRRRESVLVGPAVPTPRETKRLSDIDDQETLRGFLPFVFFYRGVARDAGDRDPASAIRGALGEALVSYYPIAGRLREVEGQKLVVDCTGEGVVFVEADADVRLPELEAATGLRPPFPWVGQLLCNIQGSGGVLKLNDCPLLFIQVTRLLCGGFVLALHLRHAICDGIGLGHFLSVVAELARGLPAPTAPPPWSRELLSKPEPAAFPRRKLGAVPMTPPPPPLTPPSGDDMVTRTFTFARRDVAAIKAKCLIRDAAATNFEVLTAALWRARTAALEVPPDEEVCLAIIVNVRGVRELGLPAGYYGNAAVPSSTAATTAGALLRDRSLGDIVEMVREAKAAAVTAEYVGATVDLLARRGWPFPAAANLFVISDNRHLGLHRVDLGWGAPVYGGVAIARFGGVFLVAVRNNCDGEDELAVPIVLPRLAMDRFAAEVEEMVMSTNKLV